MCILNGRAPGENDFTCIRPQGRSVVDYIFTSVLIADLELSDFVHDKQMAEENISPFIFGKEYNVSKIPTSFLDEDEANSETADFLDYVKYVTHSKETVSVMYEQFINVLNIEM